MDDLDSDELALLSVMERRGIVSSQELQAAIGKSQATVSRLLAGLAAYVIPIGRARSARYGLLKSIHGAGCQQPIWWTAETGEVQRLGTLSFLDGDLIHVDTDFGERRSKGAMPWFLAPLRARGYLGRQLAQQLLVAGLPNDPERWSLEHILFAALHLADAPGAITLGEPPASSPPVLPDDAKLLQQALDTLALSLIKSPPVGSSAGGEQPKFIAVHEDGRHVLVKFTPPRGSPFGERWHDLLHAECLANQVLAEHGVPVAKTSIVESAARTYLLSERFDRIGAHGRCHVIAIGDAHAAFVHGSYSNWATTGEALARQRRLSANDALRIAALRRFGQLIGNTDMHSGNLGLMVAAADLGPGRFTLAPVYDMLPMRWRPDAAFGGAPDYAPFELDAKALSSGAAGPARAYWLRLALLPAISPPLRAVATALAVGFKARPPKPDTPRTAADEYSHPKP